MGHILAIDQGTTSTRSILFDANQRIVASAQAEFPQYFPRSGWIEHDLEEIWAGVVATARAALAKSGLGPRDVAAIGISNQRETTCIWDRATGRPIHNAIVWQDRRTTETCAALREAGHEAAVTRRTGLVLDPYFSATKAAWLLDTVDGARERAEAGALAFGTIDTFLIQRLTGRHLTDATNAARTLLFDIHRGCWDDGLLDLFRVPRAMLPEVVNCAADFGVTDLLGGATPVFGVAGDQQAALIGQACFRPGMVKSTYGTGCFAVLNTGEKAVASNNRLLTTIAYQLDGSRTYALEGAIFVAGAAVQWLRDGLGLIDTSEESGRLAAASDEAQDVYLVPAFAGLGAPHWDAEARGAIFGLSRGTGRAEIARAALEAVCFQTRDLTQAMRADWGDAAPMAGLRVDGGMAASDWMLQRLADMLASPVERPAILETTALGAAWLAGRQAGVWPDMDGFAAAWRAERRFEPAMAEDVRARKYAGWRDAVSRTLTRPAAR